MKITSIVRKVLLEYINENNPESLDILTDDERKERFNNEVLPHIQHIKNMSYKYYTDPDLRKELAQDTLIQAYRKIHQFKKDTNIKGWLFLMMRNLYLNKYRQSKRNPTIPLSLDDSDSNFQDVRVYNAMKNIHGEPQIGVEGYGDEVEIALQKLSPIFREIIQLDLEGYTYEDISKILNIPIGTVRSRLNRAKTFMKNMLGGYYKQQNAYADLSESQIDIIVNQIKQILKEQY